jgi:hypothetical protein
MTPLHPSLADAPARKLQPWRTASTILACSLASMTIAVVVMAWQVTRLTRERNRARVTETQTTNALHWPSTTEIRDTVAAHCTAFQAMRATHTGLYSTDSRMPLEHSSIEDVRRGMEHDCAVLDNMRRTNTGFYAP